MGISRSTRLESFVRNDTVLWKSARSAVHHFLITSLLIGNDANRKAFASIYRYESFAIFRETKKKKSNINKMKNFPSN